VSAMSLEDCCRAYVKCLLGHLLAVHCGFVAHVGILHVVVICGEVELDFRVRHWTC
jgi:hypothetical protein